MAAYTDDMAVHGADAVAAPGRGEETRLIGPFRPGPGQLPPYLAGREEEQALFRGWGAAVAQGVRSLSPVILYGPRGNGKTALLAWMQQHFDAVPGVDVVEMTSAEIETPAQLAEQLLSSARLGALAPEELSLVGLTWRPGDDRPPLTARQTLTLRASKRPLILLLDEAHSLDRVVGRALLHAGQQVGRRYPFFLVLAGTPDLEDRLSEMEASFWGRAEQIRVNRLDPVAAAAAIERPLQDEGMSIDTAALERILSESHGYPFFLQLWGRFVWERTATEGRRLITTDDVEAAAPEFAQTRGDYYRQRYNEFARRRLAPVARAVAEAFAGVPALSHDEVEDAICRALNPVGDGDAVFEALTVMKHLGFLWQPGPTPAWEPGIPSLMDYLREHTRAS